LTKFYSLIEDYKDRPNDLNLNCTDPLGRTSLVIAIENESYELLEVLLEGGIKVSDGLLHAISEDYVEAVELLLEWEEKNHKEGTPYVRLDDLIMAERAKRISVFLFYCFSFRAGKRWTAKMPLLRPTSLRSFWRLIGTTTRS
jgi:ankyrin repeat protein